MTFNLSLGVMIRYRSHTNKIRGLSDSKEHRCGLVSVEIYLREEHKSPKVRNLSSLTCCLSLPRSTPRCFLFVCPLLLIEDL